MIKTVVMISLAFVFVLLAIIIAETMISLFKRTKRIFQKE